MPPKNFILFILTFQLTVSLKDLQPHFGMTCLNLWLEEVSNTLTWEPNTHLLYHTCV